MTAPSGLVLPPGAYLIEVTTIRPGVDADVVRRGLELAGFEGVIADEPAALMVPPEVGAAMAMSPGGVPRGASPAAPRMNATAVRASPSFRASSVLAEPTSAMVKLPPKGAAMARASTLASAVKTATAVVRSAPKKMGTAPKPKAKGGFLSMFQGGGGDDSGGTDAGPTTDGGGAAGADFAQDPNDPRYATDTATGQKYYMDPSTGAVSEVNADGSLTPVDQQTLQPIPGAATQPPPGGAGEGGTSPDAGVDTAAPGEGPFGEDPAFSLVSVGAAMPGAQTYRLVARTPAQVTLNAGEGISWAARRLEVDPYAAVPVRVKPYLLAEGQTYDMVVLSRDRKCNGRGDVFTLAEAMGFEPHDIALLQGDIHLPGRPSASYSRWLLVATWEGPTTITTAEEPLVFDQVAAGRPA